MQFPDPGPTTFRETNGESHFDRFAVSKNVRLMYAYYPERLKNAAFTAGTRNNAPPGEESPSGLVIPFKPTRISTQVSSCPPVYHNYKIRNQDDRKNYFDRELLACHPQNKRQYKPNFRSRDLSDHLPVMFTHRTASGTRYKIATWNIRFFDPTIDPLSTADGRDFARRKEIKYAFEFAAIFQQFDIVAAQELKPSKKPENVGQMGNVKNTTKLIFNKQWYWSATTPELGFAVKASIVAKNCKDIDMKATVNDEARPSFMCDFYEKSVRRSQQLPERRR